MAEQFLFPGGILSMTREAAQRLLRAQNGDAALLYLALLEQGNGEGLSWSEERLYEAFDALTALKLVDPKVPPKQALPEKPEPQQAPEYSPRNGTLPLGRGAFHPWVRGRRGG